MSLPKWRVCPFLCLPKEKDQKKRHHERCAARTRRAFAARMPAARMHSLCAAPFVDVPPRCLSPSAHELDNVLNQIRAFSAGPDERLETFAGPSTGFARAKVSSAKAARRGHAAVELLVP